MNNQIEPSVLDTIRELKRELKMRKFVYPKQVTLAKMTQNEANFQIACIEKAIKVLESLPGEQASLF
jgi:hypothetical protein